VLSAIFVAKDYGCTNGSFCNLTERRGKMAYLCENCGVVAEDSSTLCNPINEEYKSKLCTIPEPEVCDEQTSAMKYSCDCGGVSAHPQHLCRPREMQ
jgi:hypothetical protein